MRKIMAAVIAITMLLPLAFTSCGKDEQLPPPVGSGETAGGNADVPSVNESDADVTDESKTTVPEQQGSNEYVYIPDPNANYSGMVGIGSNGASFNIESITVKNSADRVDLYVNDFSGDDPLAGWSYSTAVGGTWSPDSASSVYTVADGEKGKVLSLSNADVNGSMAYFGDKQWNYIRSTFKMSINEYGNGVVIYFCMTDDNNYYQLVIGDDGGTTMTVSRIKDGTKEQLDSLPVEVGNIVSGEVFPLSISVEREYIVVYVNSVQCFNLFGEVKPKTGGIGFSSWSTGVSFDNILVTSNKDGEVIYEEDFEDMTTLVGAYEPRTYSYGNLQMGSITDPTSKDAYMAGDWSKFWVIAEGDGGHGNVMQLNTADLQGGAVVLTESLNNAKWTNYTFEFDAHVEIPNECWLIYSLVEDDNNHLIWNVGGWANTKTCFQPNVNGSITQEVQTEKSFNFDEWHHIKMIITDSIVLGYVDGELISTHAFA